MKAVFSDMQDYSTSLDGATVRDRNELFAVMDSARDREPFVCELEGENGYKLMLGIGKDVGCVQYSPIDGDIPYLMALAPGNHYEGEYIEFLMGNTPSSIPRRNCLPLEMVKEIAAYFIETGGRWSAVSWEEV
jgi:Immunity protein Imm1